MIQTMTEISLYIIIAIFLGYLFGWLITKTFLEEKYEKRLKQYYDENAKEIREAKSIKQELEHYKKTNKELIEENSKLALGFNGQKYALDENNATLDEFQKLLKSKNDVIEKLTIKLSSLEDKQLALKKRYDTEIDAFLLERVDITKKYKALLEKLKKSDNFKDVENHDSWFSKVFSTPAKS